MAFDYAVALTGSIATGKSTVIKYFLEDGIAVIDADAVAHEILDAQHVRIAEMFGKALVFYQKVDRKALGKIIFSDTEKREALEALLHPLIYEEIENRSEALDRTGKPYIVDIPLFFETERYPVEKVVVVHAPEAKQCERLMKRDGLTEDEARKRMALQLGVEEKCKRATYLIDNSGDRKQLYEAYQRAKEAIIKDFS